MKHVQGPSDDGYGVLQCKNAEVDFFFGVNLL